eukprot:GHVU01109416.1.p1 GENE.GHVU01109416.1~~GHVU01109416.1.p1  ORF type:complete len:391 (+),score=4.43 GHVU01109416.1:89-1261(+)
MGYCTVCSLVCAALPLALAIYIMTVPVPSGFTEPWKLKLTLAAMKSTFKLSVALEWLGYGTKWDNYEYMINMPFSSRKWDVNVTDTEFGGVKVRLYRPYSKATRAMLYFHTTGWTSANLAGLHNDWSRKLEMVIVLIRVRHIPYPASLEDCEASTMHFLDNLHLYGGVDATRVAIAGDGYGASLAAAVVFQLSKSRPGSVRLQLLLYPALQAIDFQTPAHQDLSLDPLDHRSLVAETWLKHSVGHTRYLQEMLNNIHVSPEAKAELYPVHFNHNFLPPKLFPKQYKQNSNNVGKEGIWNELKDVFLDPNFTPILASDDTLRHVPESYILTCHHDFLRDDGFFYARKLQKNGVKVTHIHLPEAVHGILNLLFLEDARRANDALVQFMAQKL